MNIRTLLGVGALLVAAAIPATSLAQRTHRNAPRTSYGRGPFYPSYVPGPSYNYFGSGRVYRSGSASFLFGPGGGYYGNYPTYYGYPYGGYYGPSNYYRGGSSYRYRNDRRHRSGGYRRSHR